MGVPYRTVPYGAALHGASAGADAAFGYFTPLPSACTHVGWTDERVESLKGLWIEGCSASQIARELGGVTRNAVIGKVHRLHLPGREKPSKPARLATPRAERPVKLRPPPPIPVSLEPRPDHIVDCLMLTAHSCKWPIGDPQHPNFTFCGRHVEAGPYCHEHHQVAYQPPQAKKSTVGSLLKLLRRYA